VPTIGSGPGAHSDLPEAAAVTGMHTLIVEHIVSAFDANNARMAQRMVIVQLRACSARHRERFMIKGVYALAADRTSAIYQCP
jgi:hypothetical protein